MPTTDLPGWRLKFTDDFTTDVALGSFPVAVSDRWGAYPYPWSFWGGYYHPERVSSIHDGMLDYWLHAEDGQWLMGAALPRINGPAADIDQLYGRYAVSFCADAVPGYYAAWMLWPDSEVWPRDGEIDFPEGGLTETVNAFMHRQGATTGSDQDAFSTDVPLAGCHVVITEWRPNSVAFILDGELIGHSTSRVPNTPMHAVYQITVGRSLPPAGTEGHVYIDWIAVWGYAP